MERAKTTAPGERRGRAEQSRVIDVRHDTAVRESLCALLPTTRGNNRTRRTCVAAGYSEAEIMSMLPADALDIIKEGRRRQ